MDELLVRASRLHRAGQLREAQKLCRELLDADPDNVQAHYLHGLTCGSLGAPSEAAASFERAVRLAPDHAEARFQLGLALGSQGRLDEAIEHLERAASLDADSAEIAGHLRQARAAVEHRRAQALAAGGDLAGALASFERLLALLPDNADVLCNLGLVLARQERSGEAIARYRQALAVQPDHFDACLHLAHALLRDGAAGEAQQWYRRATTLKPDDAAAHANLATALLGQDRFDEAETQFQRALELNPSDAASHLFLGISRLMQQKVTPALRAFEQAIALRPDDPEAHHNRAWALLLSENFGEGLAEYEWRFRSRYHAPVRTRWPLWDGSPLDGRTIVLVAEQGLGDTIQFIRYAAMLKRRRARVIVECPASLHALLARTPGIDAWTTPDAAPPDADCCLPLLSVAHRLGTTFETIPADIPYVHADPDLIDAWRARLAEHKGFKIGIAWQGNPGFPLDRYRSIPLTALAPLAALPGVRLVVLQKGAGREQLTDTAGDWPIVDYGDALDAQRGAFTDTSAIMQSLDLIIASDSAPAHLAGALGVPVWVALGYAPDWRWMLAREDCPWYPTMRLFRQSAPGNWRDVFGRIAAEVARRM